MICVPTELLKQYTQLLGKRNTPKDLYFNYQKWLRYYLDFCHINTNLYPLIKTVCPISIGF